VARAFIIYLTPNGMDEAQMLIECESLPVARAALAEYRDANPGVPTESFGIWSQPTMHVPGPEVTH